MHGRTERVRVPPSPGLDDLRPGTNRLPNYQLEAAIVEYWPYCATLHPVPLTRSPRLYEVKESGSPNRIRTYNLSVNNRRGMGLNHTVFEGGRSRKIEAGGRRG